MRDKRSLGDQNKIRESIPYAYLLQLGMKHLEKKNHLLTEFGRRSRYDEILRVASAYLEVLNLHGHSVMEEIFSGYENFPMLLSCNMLYEKMCIPMQYHPDYVELLITKLIGPFYEEITRRKPMFSLDEYIDVMRFVLRKANGPAIISVEEMSQNLFVSPQSLESILSEISFESSEINKDFVHFLDATDTWKRPLVKLTGNRYFCLDARMAGFTFYEVLYQLVYKTMGKMLNRELGEALEKVTYSMFEENKIPFIKGKYKCLNDLPERDCDMIIEDDNHLV